MLQWHLLEVPALLLEKDGWAFIIPAFVSKGDLKQLTLFSSLVFYPHKPCEAGQVLSG